MATTAVASVAKVVLPSSKVSVPESPFIAWFKTLQERARYWGGGVIIEPLTDMEYQWIHHKELHW